jgi:hypothetical protein
MVQDFVVAARWTEAAATAKSLGPRDKSDDRRKIEKIETCRKIRQIL